MGGILFRLRTWFVALAVLGAALPSGAQQSDPTSPFVTGPPDKPPVALTNDIKEELLRSLSDIVTKEAFVSGVDLTKWPEFLEKQRDAIDKAEKDSELARAVNAAMRDFGVSHMRFLPPRVAQARVRTTTVGIGVSVLWQKDGLVITTVYPQSPADNAGIHQGDFILTVDGKTPTASDALQGDIDTEVALKIRPKDGAEHDVTLKRSRYSVVYSNTISWPTSEAALIKIWSFARGYDRSAIEELMRQAQKAKYLILDLRGNAGGATNNLQHLLSLLMPEDTIIGTFVNRPLYDQYHEAHPDYVETDPVVIAKDSKLHYLTRHLSVDPFKGKIAVLVNRGTASASEIVAWALRENLHVPILGTQSAGAVLASIYHRLPYGYEVQYPISDYVTKNGIRLENHPIIPDVETSESAVDGKDSAVDKAIERLKTLTIDR